MSLLKVGIVAALAAVAAALPKAQIPAEMVKRSVLPPPIHCDPVHHTNVTGKTGPGADGHQTLGSTPCDASQGACQVSHGNSYTVTAGFSIGASETLNLEDILSLAGLTGSYTYSTAKGVTNTATQSCPKGPWACNALITPVAVTVSGWGWVEYENTEGCAITSPEYHQYTAYFPQMNDGQPVVEVGICTCPNLGANPNAPGALRMCPMDC